MIPDIATYPSPTAKASVRATASGSIGRHRPGDRLGHQEQLAEAAGCVGVLSDHLPPFRPSERRDARYPRPDRKLTRATRPEGHHLTDEFVTHDHVPVGIPHKQPRHVVGIRMVHVVDIRRADRRADRPHQQSPLPGYWGGRLAYLEPTASQHHCTQADHPPLSRRTFQRRPGRYRRQRRHRSHQPIRMVSKSTTLRPHRLHHAPPVDTRPGATNDPGRGRGDQYQTPLHLDESSRIRHEAS